MKRYLLALHLAIALPTWAADPATSSTSSSNPFDSSQQPCRVIANAPSVTFDEDSAVPGENLRDYIKCGREEDFAITYSVDPAVPGLAIDQSVNNVFTYGGTPTTPAGAVSQDICADNASAGTAEVCTTRNITITTVAGTGGTPVPAGSYYVCPDGQDGPGANGLSHAQRWRTMSKVSQFSGYAPGADVYLCDAGVWDNQTLSIGWDGTSSNWTVVGSYYMSGGQAFVGYQVRRPELNGTYDAACRVNDTCLVDTAGAVPGSRFGNLIEVLANYVRVQDIKSAHSAGRAFTAHGANTRSHVEFRNVWAYHSVNSGINIERHNYGTVRNSLIELTALQRVDGIQPNAPSCLIVGSDSQGTSIRPGNHLIEHNVVTQCGHEGIGVLRTSFVVVRGNRVSNTFTVPGYNDNSSDTVWEGNIFTGTGFDGDRRNFDTAISISVEPYGGTSLSNTHNSLRVLVRNNLFANIYPVHLSVFSSSRFGPGEPAVAGFKVGARIFGNTAKNSKTGNAVTTNSLTVNNNIDFIEVAGNVFDGAHECNAPAVPESLLSFHHNAWSAQPANSRCYGTGSVSGTIDLAGPSALLNATGLNFPDFDDAELGASSVADEIGANLTDTILNIANWPRKADFTVGPVATCIPSDANWVKENVLDEACVVRGTPSDPGARED